MKKLVSLIVIIFVFSTLVLNALAEDDVLQEKFSSAYELTIKGEYKEARVLYGELLQQAPKDPQLLYNAGTCELLAGHLGQAVLFLERSLKLEPDFEDCQLNLARALELQKDKVIVKQSVSQQEGTTLDGFMESVHIDTLSYLLIISNLVLLVIFLIRRFSSSERSRFSYSLLLFIVLFAEILFAGLLTLKAYNYEDLEYAVILVEEVDVRKGPNQNYQSDFTVHEGLKVRLGEKIEDWQQIWLSNGLNGYVSEKSLEQI